MLEWGQREEVLKAHFEGREDTATCDVGFCQVPAAFLPEPYDFAYDTRIAGQFAFDKVKGFYRVIVNIQPQTVERVERSLREVLGPPTTKMSKVGIVHMDWKFEQVSVHLYGSNESLASGSGGALTLEYTPPKQEAEAPF